jgi:hypothetical protein
MSLSHRQPIAFLGDGGQALYPAGEVVYRTRYFAILGRQRRRASVPVLTAVIYLEGVPVLELKSGPMTSALWTFETCRRSL